MPTTVTPSIVSSLSGLPPLPPPLAVPLKPRTCAPFPVSLSLSLVYRDFTFDDSSTARHIFHISDEREERRFYLRASLYMRQHTVHKAYIFRYNVIMIKCGKNDCLFPSIKCAVGYGTRAFLVINVSSGLRSLARIRVRFKFR